MFKYTDDEADQRGGEEEKPDVLLGVGQAAEVEDDCRDQDHDFDLLGCGVAVHQH